MDTKQLIIEYYKEENFMNSDAMDYFIHNDVEIQWHSSKGFLKLDKFDLQALAKELKKSYSAARIEISHLFCEEDKAVVRYTHYVNAIENPSEEMVLAHFVSIWEIKNNKLYKGFLMSQLG